MTNQQHPITPPLELRRLWAQQAQRMDPHDPVAWMEHVSTQAARWGADQELEACCEWLPSDLTINGESLRDHRRPKPPSLAEEAMKALRRQAVRSVPSLIATEDCDTIRRALERLQELEKGNE